MTGIVGSAENGPQERFAQFYEKHIENLWDLLSDLKLQSLKNPHVCQHVHAIQCHEWHKQHQET